MCASPAADYLGEVHLVVIRDTHAVQLSLPCVTHSLHALNRARLKEMSGVKKKSKAGQQRAEDRADRPHTFPMGARPLGMHNRHRSADPAGMCILPLVQSLVLN